MRVELAYRISTTIALLALIACTAPEEVVEPTAPPEDLATATVPIPPTASPTTARDQSDPLDRRTGIAALDAIIDAVLADDVDALRDMVRYTVTGCTHESGLGGPPKCAPNQQEGALVEVLPLLGSEGTFAGRDTVERVFPLGAKRLHAVFRVPDEAFEADYWPVGEYGIVFLSDGEPLPAATTYLVDDGKIVRIIYHMSLEGLFTLEYGLKAQEFVLLPPAAPVATPTPTAGDAPPAATPAPMSVSPTN